MLTRKQHELLMFIDKHLRTTGFSPSFEEMKDALRLKSKSGIHRLITALEEPSLPEPGRRPTGRRRRLRPQGRHDPHHASTARRKARSLNQNFPDGLQGRYVPSRIIRAGHQGPPTVARPPVRVNAVRLITISIRRDTGGAPGDPDAPHFEVNDGAWRMRFVLRPIMTGCTHILSR